MFRVVLLSLSLVACQREPVADAPPADAEQRARVMAFWELFHAATERRSARDCAAAVPLYRQALELDRRHEDSLYYLGQCLRELRQAGGSRQVFERLLEVNPRSARGHMALGALLASPDADEPLDLAAAERSFRRAHDLNLEETGPLVRLAEVLIVTSRQDEARALLEAAARSNPKSVEAAALAGYLAWTQGHAERAQEYAARARQAAHVEAPVKGVLGEGDRRSAADAGPRPPPLENPMGRMLFSEALAALLAEQATAHDSERTWRAIERVRNKHARRVAPAGED